MKKVFLVVYIVCLSVSAFSQNRDHSLKRLFKNQDAAVINGVRLEFNDNGRIVSAHTDINGEFEVQLSPGRYQLTIDKSISDQFVAFVDIRETGLNPAFVEFVVETSPNPCAARSADLCPRLTKFVKPPYPQAARAVRAQGEVTVAVTFDRTGKVVSAAAESGHPLLRQAAEKAALQSAFEPSEKTGERQARLSFVFIPRSQAEEKDDIKRYTAYRVEIYEAEPLPIDYSSAK